MESREKEVKKEARSDSFFTLPVILSLLPVVSRHSGVEFSPPRKNRTEMLLWQWLNRWWTHNLGVRGGKTPWRSPCCTALAPGMTEDNNGAHSSSSSSSLAPCRFWTLLLAISIFFFLCRLFISYFFPSSPLLFLGGAGVYHVIVLSTLDFPLSNA